MRRSLAAAAASIALTTQIGTAAAAVHAPSAKKKVTTVTKTVTGSTGSADRWGDVQVTLVVKKTTTVVGSKKTVKRRIASVKVPVYPNHTDRSVFINEQAIPLLVQEALRIQFDVSQLQLVSGATDTSYGFADSLQSALAAARKV
jgi:uncharacterized protein with FMN-binding domain